MRNDIVEILCDINPLLDPDDEDMSIAEFLESKQLMELIARLDQRASRQCYKSYTYIQGCR